MATKARHVNVLQFLKPSVNTHVAKGTPHKRLIINQAARIFESRGVVILNVRSASTAEITAIRAELAKVGGSLKFVKNTLARRAAEAHPGPTAALRHLLHGTVGLLYTDKDCEDPMAVFKATMKLVEKNEQLAILGGALDGTVLTAEGMGAAAKLPPLQTVQGQLVSALIGPSHSLASALSMPKLQVATALAQSLEAPSRRFARSATMRKEQLQEAGSAATAAAGGGGGGGGAPPTE